MILDTNAVSALFAGNNKLGKKLENSEQHHLPVVVLGEYRFGLMNSNKKRHLEYLLDILESESQILSHSLITAKHYAEIRQQLKKSGTPIPENDIWIAALAKEYNLEIVSIDKHFDYVKKVKRISW